MDILDPPEESFVINMLVMETINILILYIMNDVQKQKMIIILGYSNGFGFRDIS